MIPDKSVSLDSSSSIQSLTSLSSSESKIQITPQIAQSQGHSYEVPSALGNESKIETPAKEVLDEIHHLSFEDVSKEIPHHATDMKEVLQSKDGIGKDPIIETLTSANKVYSEFKNQHSKEAKTSFHSARGLVSNASDEQKAFLRDHMRMERITKKEESLGVKSQVKPNMTEEEKKEVLNQIRERKKLETQQKKVSSPNNLFITPEEKAKLKPKVEAEWQEEVNKREGKKDLLQKPNIENRSTDQETSLKVKQNNGSNLEQNTALKEESLGVKSQLKPNMTEAENIAAKEESLGVKSQVKPKTEEEKKEVLNQIPERKKLETQQKEVSSPKNLFITPEEKAKLKPKVEAEWQEEVNKREGKKNLLQKPNIENRSTDQETSLKVKQNNGTKLEQNTAAKIEHLKPSFSISQATVDPKKEVQPIRASVANPSEKTITKTNSIFKNVKNFFKGLKEKMTLKGRFSSSKAASSQDMKAVIAQNRSAAKLNGGIQQSTIGAPTPEGAARKFISPTSIQGQSSSSSLAKKPLQEDLYSKENLNQLAARFPPLSTTQNSYVPPNSQLGQPGLYYFVDKGQFVIKNVILNSNNKTIYEVVNTETGKSMVLALATKTIQNQRELENEKYFHQMFSHMDPASEHFVAGKVADFGGQVAFLMPMMKGGDVSKFLEKTPTTSSQKMQMFSHMLNGVKQMHDKGLRHLDIKMENFLIGDDPLKPKLSDYGTCSVSNPQIRPATNDRKIRSPEHQAGFHAGTQADIWALGVTLAEMHGLSKVLLNNLHQAVFTNPAAVTGAIAGICQSIHQKDPEAASIIFSCLKIDPSRRPNIDQLKQLVDNYKGRVG